MASAIAGGALRPGQRLPSHRSLAAELGIAPLTVKRAYDELEGRGLLVARRGAGSFVAEAPPPQNEERILERLRPAAHRLVAAAELAGLSFGRLVDLLWEERGRIRYARTDDRP